jgi:hypothetical protein
VKFSVIITLCNDLKELDFIALIGFLGSMFESPRYRGALVASTPLVFFGEMDANHPFPPAVNSGTRELRNDASASDEVIVQL